MDIFLKLLDGTDGEIMTERIDIGAGLGLYLVHGQREDLSIDQGHVLVHDQKGKLWKVP